MGKIWNFLLERVFILMIKDTPEKLKETKLPPKEAFYSKLNSEGISDEDYAHAQRVWEAFEIKKIRRLQ